jgi:hypothetical protein
MSFIGYAGRYAPGQAGLFFGPFMALVVAAEEVGALAGSRRSLE